jgi:CsoR family transcriptional regulator, copper-sensing transcriptional repressor
MNLKNPETKQAIISRLRRIEGQVHGVASMVDQERDCQEVLQQLTAIRSATQSVSLLFLREYATYCLTSMENNTPEDRKRLVQDMIDLMGKVP